MKKLSPKERSLSLKKLTGWKMVKGRNAISKTYKFKDFSRAFHWMTAIALYAEKKNHHPEWFNVYNKIDVILSTHDAKGVSNLDIDLAKKMDLQFKKS
jgi:4a-hydroxytetrahydrobiopterin dehydratase|tara:strand:+ start:2438 stop:2731 length:294 start_codon:yes stop_codon:yes gene_type:complete